MYIPPFIQTIQNLIEAHRAGAVHNQPQPPVDHDNAAHTPDFEVEGVAAAQIEAHRAGAVHDQPQPPQDHGNEAHTPDFEVQGVAAGLVEAHRAGAVHDQPQPPADHGNEAHTPDFEATGVAAAMVEAHRANAVHTQPQPPQDHGNEAHTPDFASEAALTGHAGNPSAHHIKYTDAEAAAVAAALVAIHEALTTGVHGVSGAIVGTSDTQTLTNKRNQSRVSSNTSGNISPDVSVADIYIRTAQAAALTINNPIGSPAESEKLIIRLKDNGTARTITFGNQYRALEYALPTTTVISKLLYMGFMFNSTDTKWDMVAINQQA